MVDRMPPYLRLFERLFLLPAEDMDQLARLASASSPVEARRTLIQAGAPCDRCLLLKEGWAIEYRLLRDGTRQILNFRLPGDVIGVECLAYETALHSVASLTACDVACISREELEGTLREFPLLGTALFLMSMREGAILHEWEVNLGRRAAFQRLAHLLLEMFKRLHVRGLSERDAVPFPATQQDLADCLGLTAPYVNRLIRRLQEDSLISLENRTLRILDPEGLAKTVKFRPDYIQAWRENPLQSMERQQAS